MSSWNNLRSYARNVKLHHLTFKTREGYQNGLALLETEEAMEGMRRFLNRVPAETGGEWRAGFNGRSGGYVVLYRAVRDGRASSMEDVDSDEVEFGFDDWSDEAVRRRYETVALFDRIVDEMIAWFTNFAETHRVVESEEMVMRRERVRRVVAA